MRVSIHDRLFEDEFQSLEKKKRIERGSDMFTAPLKDLKDTTASCWIIFFHNALSLKHQTSEIKHMAAATYNPPNLQTI